MELKDTVKGMMSDDYKERMAAEYHQTKIRYEKLKKLNTRIFSRVAMSSRRSQRLHSKEVNILWQQLPAST